MAKSINERAAVEDWTTPDVSGVEFARVKAQRDELLAALNALTEEIFGVSDIDESVRAAALAAIAKAEQP